jgi:predicted DNA-binding transcriptional regulator AlpA
MLPQATKVRRAIRGKEARAMLGGLSNSQFYAEIAAGRIPPPTKLFPSSRLSTWWSDELETIIDAAIARRDAERAEKAQAASEHAAA